MKQSFVIFVCTFDPFHIGRHVYTFENRCVEMAYDEKYREGLETGIQQGIERGIEQGITTSARRMLSSGKYSDSEISEITGLSVEQIQALKNSAK